MLLLPTAVCVAEDVIKSGGCIPREADGWLKKVGTPDHAETEFSDKVAITPDDDGEKFMPSSEWYDDTGMFVVAEL